MMRAFALTFGGLLAVDGSLGLLRQLSLLPILGGSSFLLWEAFVSLVFMIGGITTCIMSKRLDPASHWAETLVSAVFAIFVVAIFYGILRIAIPMKLGL